MLPELLPERARLERVHMNAALVKEATVDILAKELTSLFQIELDCPSFRHRVDATRAAWRHDLLPFLLGSRSWLPLASLNQLFPSRAMMWIRKCHFQPSPKSRGQHD